MEIASSYKVKLQNIPKQVYSTLTVYRKAVSYVISLIKMEWINITSISKQLQQKSFIENLIHTTKTNQAKYDFDIQFPNFPSYLRRAVIAQALGAYSAYISSLENYNSLSQEEQSKIKPPALQLDRNLTPTFYKDNMGDYEDIFNPNLKSNTIRLKLYNGKTWNWYNIQCKQKDLNYLHKHWTGIKANCPTILKKNKKFYLVFSFTEKVNLKKTPLQDQKILSIDLGINTDATCSILKSDGTVIDRRFINLPVEKGCYLEMLKTINSVKSEYSQLYGEKEGNDRVRKLWRFFNNKTKNHDIKLVKEIIDFAKLHNVDVIVYEHLDFKGSKGNQKLSHWRKNAIQKRIEHQAHRLGIRISTVNARNTSKLAFDGSGKVIRSVALPSQKKVSYSICRFQSGKYYNADLSASYNIGARYFLREFCKLDKELEKKIPSPTNRVLSDLKTMTDKSFWKLSRNHLQPLDNYATCGVIC